MTGLRYDSEYASAFEPLPNADRTVPSTALEMREGGETFLRNLLLKLGPGNEIQQTNYSVQSFDGVDVQLRHFATAEHFSAPTPQPTVLAIHGGGLVFGGTLTCVTGIYAQDVLDGDRPVFAVEYRLAPKHKIPTVVEDAYADFTYLLRHEKELNTDS